MGNIMALSMARHRHSTDIKTKGMFGMDRLTVLTSEDVIFFHFFSPFTAHSIQMQEFP